MSLIKISNIGTNIVHIIMDDKKSLARAMCRFQEFYESPFEDIKGCIFTLGYLKSKGSRANPRLNTYCGNELVDAEWAGYNFPSIALEPFVKGLFDPLTTEESSIVEMLRYRTDNFYIIATYGDNDDADALEHEIRHGMYGTCVEYKKEVDNALLKYEKDLVNLKKCLSSWGYIDEVMNDECHAYMGADHDYFFENFKEDVEKYNIIKLPKLKQSLNRIANKYKIKLGINV